MADQRRTLRQACPLRDTASGRPGRQPWLALGFAARRLSAEPVLVLFAAPEPIGDLDGLPPATRQLLLLAAADPTGDPALLWRAVAQLGITSEAASPAAEAGLITFDGRVVFRNHQVRSTAPSARARGTPWPAPGLTQRSREKTDHPNSMTRRRYRDGAVTRIGPGSLVQPGVSECSLPASERLVRRSRLAR